MIGGVPKNQTGGNIEGIEHFISFYGPRRQIRVSEIIVHESFDFSFHDIALLKLGTDVIPCDPCYHHLLYRRASRPNRLQPGLSSWLWRDFFQSRWTCLRWTDQCWEGFVSSVRSSYSHPDLLLITTPLFQITPVLNTGLSLSEPLQLYKGYNAI